MYFNYEEISLSNFLKCFNEPHFYFYSLSGLNAESKDIDEWTPMIWASYWGYHEVVKYLYTALKQEALEKILY